MADRWDDGPNDGADSESDLTLEGIEHTASMCSSFFAKRFRLLIARICELERELSIAKGNNAARMDGLADAIATLERARPAAVAAVPEGWKLIAVNEGFDAFMAATHRADNKGYLPDAMRDEWAAFDYNAVQIAAAEAPNGEEQP